MESEESFNLNSLRSINKEEDQESKSQQKTCPVQKVQSLSATRSRSSQQKTRPVQEVQSLSISRNDKQGQTSLAWEVKSL
ncbi:hypothetical protein TNCV_1565491 [Trichonephila clavipes]|nr:hypothetical protein TNCV_1565491 [Trichonephila clavipes]